MAKNKELPTLKDISRVPEELVPVVQWWQDHGVKTLCYVVPILLVIGAGYLYHARHSDNTVGAASSLATAGNMEEILRVVTEADTSVSPLAKLQLANNLYHSANYSEALGLYDALLVECDDPALKDIAVVGRIYALSALNRDDEAATAAEQAAATIAEGHYLYADLLKAKATILCKQGDKEAAKAVLAPLLNAPEGSDLAAQKGLAERLVKAIDAYTKKAPAALPTELPTEAAALPAEPAAPEAPATEAPAPEATPEAPAPAPEA